MIYPFAWKIKCVCVKCAHQGGYMEVRDKQEKPVLSSMENSKIKLRSLALVASTFTSSDILSALRKVFKHHWRNSITKPLSVLKLPNVIVNTQSKSSNSVPPLLSHKKSSGNSTVIKSRQRNLKHGQVFNTPEPAFFSKLDVIYACSNSHEN